MRRKFPESTLDPSEKLPENSSERHPRDHFPVRLLFTEEKLLFHCLPSFFGQSAALILILSLIAGIYFQTIPEEESAVSVTVAVVMPDDSDDAESNLAFRLFTAAANFPAILHFEVTSEENAVRMVRSGNAAGALVLPENFLTDALNGNEMNIKVYFSAQSGYENLLFRDLSDAAVTMLLDIQSACYAAHEVAWDAGFSAAEDDDGNEIVFTYVRTVLSRLNFFETQAVRATGSYEPLYFYSASVLLLLLFLTGLSFAPLFSWQNAAFYEKLRIHRVSQTTSSLILTITCCTYFLILLLILFGVLQLIPAAREITAEMNGLSFLSLLLVVFSCSAMICAVYRIFQSRNAAALVLFFGGVLMLFCSGSIIPSVFLPNVFKTAAPFLPAYFWQQTLAGALSGSVSLYSLAGSLAFGVLFFVLSAALPCFRGNFGKRGEKA